MVNKSGDGVSSLVQGWRTLSAWERDGHPGFRKWNRLVDQLTSIAEAVVAQPEQMRALQLIADNDGDPSVRQRARQWVRPSVPCPDSIPDLQRWMKHPLVNLHAVDLQPRVGLAVLPLRDPGPDNLLPPDPDSLTWLLGEPVAIQPQWPRRTDDVPLAHLVQVELTDHPPVTKQHPAFPREGVLQFFHDLETSGDEPTDAGKRAWSVRYTPHPSPSALAKPDDLGDDAHRPRQPAETQVTWTFPNPLDLTLTDEQFTHVEQARERVTETLASRWGAFELGETPSPAPTLLGHAAESVTDITDLLTAVLPLQAPEDSHLLLIDIPGEGPFDGWFADMGHLEYWIRASDLSRGAFDHAWALLR